MKMNSLSAALVAAGLVATGAAGALSLPQWLDKSGAHAVSIHAIKATADQPAANADANGATGGDKDGAKAIAVTVANTTPEPVPMLSDAQGTPDYRAIVKQAGPAVVGVMVAGQRDGSEQDGRGMDPRSRGFDPRERGGNPSQPFRGQGSGFIISSDGLILTNAHVVQGAREVIVKMSDRREFRAKVLGADSVTDVAVLRIEATGLPTVRLGDPRKLEVGDPVLAIGAPYGLEQSVTKGIVSAKGRSLPGDSAIVPFIQTDAAVNPGNSGGPLFDGSGAVVGINSQIYSESGGFQGLSFAIPINLALKVRDQIVATGKASHGRLGVQVQDLSQDLANSFGLTRPDGALVSQVVANSAAAKAGLQPGDVIGEVNGEPVVRSGALSSLVGMAAPGDKVTLKVWRDGSWRNLDARLGGIDGDGKQTASADGAAQGPRLGLALRPLTRDERREAQLEQGLVVEGVTGAAARAGIEPGDVLLAINGKPVKSIEQVQSVMAGKPNSVALLVQRDGDKMFVPVTPGG
jgi:serine protease Do